MSSAELKGRFVVSHGLLRAILGLYCDTDPGSLNLQYGRYGKPFLADTKEVDHIGFSVSHCGSSLALALIRERDIGLDIEAIRSFSGMAKFVERFFSKDEREEFQSSKGDHRTRAFFETWTGKEAYVKGTGEGLAKNLRRISVAQGSGGIRKVRVFSRRGWNPVPWTVYNFEPEVGLLAGLAVGPLLL